MIDFESLYKMAQHGIPCTIQLGEQTKAEAIRDGIEFARKSGWGNDGSYIHCHKDLLPYVRGALSSR